MKKNVTILLALVMILVLVAGCAPAATAPEAAEAPAAEAAPTEETDDGSVTIAFSCKTVTNDDYLNNMNLAIEAWCSEKGYTYILSVGGAQGAVNEQVNGFEDLLNRGVDAVVLAASDANAFIPALQAYKEAGVPVVIADSGVAEGNEDLYVTFVGTDNVASAKQGGQALVEFLGDKGGDVIMCMGSAGAQSGEQRSQGYREAVEGTNVKIVAEEYGDWDSSTAMGVVENMLQAHPEAIGLFSASDVMYPGIISAVQAAGKDEFYIVSHDGFKLVNEELNNGNMFACVMTQPKLIATTAADIAVQAANGTIDPNIEKFVKADVVLLTKDNIAEYVDSLY